MSQLALPEAVCDTPPPRADLERLIQEHFAFIWRCLRRLGLPPSDADDAAQHVFLIAGAKLERILPGKERAFLYGCALRRASKWQKAQSRERRNVSLEPELLDEQVSPTLSAEDQLDRAQARCLLDALLAEMPVTLRSVFVLFELEQLDTFEIAELLGLPRGTVASRLRRAREDFERRVKRLESASRARGGVR